ncbi:uncharacterized protein SRS1_15596 [Sporisorium reilianum f. sp. reilianum]|uniref:Glutathione S-transferase n=1 Tax=Sporisorium reilianum f. sp. reilianum TaxID=72559 RepID=A0A2N8UK69_9BASI|nr:uncharacterized protein SRS1_15596 [Sporisorium reilianum f. sp. reilianum]
MTMVEGGKVVLYTAKVCPYAARAELALALAGIAHDKYEVDLLNKPSWYAERINRASKVPVLVSTSEGREFKLPESLVIVEYINDVSNKIFTSSNPQHRARSRYIVERYAQLVQPQYVATALRRDASALPALKSALVAFNDLLKEHDTEGKGDFIQGEDRFGYADLNIAPFVARILSASRNACLPDAQGRRIDDEVEEGAEGLERVKAWWDAVQTVKVWAEVWDEGQYLAPLKKRLAEMHAQNDGAK